MARGRIIVGVDFSDASRIATDYAALLAQEMGLGLHVVHAWNPTGWNADVLGDDAALTMALSRARERAESQLRVWAGFADDSGIAVTTEVIDGAASRILPEVAGRLRASLVIVGRHGHASLAHVFLGSVSERLVRISPCPVLIVPPNGERLALPSRILVGIDFSSGAREALHDAIRFGRDLHSDQGLTLVHAYQDEREQWLSNWSEAHLVGERHQDERSLKKWVANEDFGRLPVEYVAVPGYAEQMIPSTASKHRCDWIVLGVQGRSALASFLVGSTTQRILRLAHCPVLVVPPQSAPESEGVD